MFREILIGLNIYYSIRLRKYVYFMMPSIESFASVCYSNTLKHF
jgi:hypothetical protein